ncbi:MAG: DUF1800 domain-containing protein [Abitibacteriaceae bacterium]|nr:DUF1800 domain-containing protein [Abditibacteriaceae bacterium]
MALPSPEKRKLAHLLRRAGFGVRPDEWEEYSRLGLAGTTQRLLHPETVPDNLEAILKSIGGDYVDFENLDSIKQWWLYRMVHTKRPLEEKMTLFWHNHFATANYKVNSASLMWQQNQLFRTHALGDFRTLLQAVARDAAMLIWLDGGQNRNGAPNENFAREVMELFTMGVGSGYTEKDIQEAARSLTGWRYDEATKSFIFDAGAHDDGEKTVLGQTGNFYSDDVLDIVARQPATAHFLSTKLFKFFVHDDPGPADIAKLSQVYFKSGYSIRAMLESIFTSPVFYSEAAFFAKVKSPVEFTVMTMRSLNANMSMVAPLASVVAGMGQELFNPPNVKGWLEGRDWINGRTLLARVNFAIQLADELNRHGALQHLLADLTPGNKAGGNNVAVTQAAAMNGPAMGTASMQGANMQGATMQGGTMTTATMNGPAMSGADTGGAAKQPPTTAPVISITASPERVVDTLWDALLTGHTPTAKTRSLLINYLYEGDEKQLGNKLPGLINLILAAPEYQLA